ncbi:flagellin [Zavarzinia compransoris]|nr:flagellin [Zavarzinia compransoris]TDP43349.1 flagellin-like hook-associated protein FlgL [Zavarzinia compransoris]
MLSVSTYASQLTTLANIQRNQSDFDRLSRQVATGVKSDDLSDFSAVDAQRLLNGDKEVQRLEAYNKGIDIVTPRLKLYSQQVERMDTLAKTVASALSGVDSYSGATQVQLGTLIDNTLRDLNALLNDRVDGRYLWAGGNYASQPVGDLTALPDLAAPAAFTPVADPALPDYYAAAPGSDANAWVEAGFSPEAGKSVEYGQVASAPAIQELINALRLVKSGLNAAAAAGSTAAAETAFAGFRTEALSQLTEARSGIKQMSSEIAMDLASITDSAKANKAAINLFVDEQGKIVNVDTAEAGVKLSQVKTQLEATYKITASLSQTSLVNYI